MITRRQTLAGGVGLMASQVAWAGEDLLPAFKDLVFGDELLHRTALAELSARGGVDLVAGLIFALRFARADTTGVQNLLTRVTGDPGPQDWFDWMLWQEAHPEVTPDSSYVELKRQLYLRIDPNFDVFLRPEHLVRDRMRIRFEEMTWGGVRKDGIPSLDNPRMIDVNEADYLLDSDPVFGVSINGDVRAYPLRIMGWHEMFNDVIGGVPVALAYCTLCGAGILFETDIGEDAPLVFGSSGFLYRSNKLMFDRKTHSLWNQFTGKPVMGELVDSGLELRQRPVTIEPWLRWKARNPDSRVLSIRTGHVRDYGSGVVYQHYFTSPNLMFPTLVDQTRLRQKDYVFGIRTKGAAKAWPLGAFEGGRVINDTVGDLNVVLIGDRLGRTVRAYDRGDRQFIAGDTPTDLRSGGTIWTIGEDHLTASDGTRAPRVAGHVAYWFAWDGYMGARSEFYDG